MYVLLLPILTFNVTTLGIYLFFDNYNPRYCNIVTIVINTQTRRTNVNIYGNI